MTQIPIETSYGICSSGADFIKHILSQRGLCSIDTDTPGRLFERTVTLIQKELSALDVCGTLLSMAVVFACFFLVCMVSEHVMKHPMGIVSRIFLSLTGAYALFMTELALISREADSRDGIFVSSMFSSSLTELEKIYVFLNVLFFVPFGLFLAAGLYGEVRGIKSVMLTILVCSIFTFFIECTQRATGRGYFEVADIEANILGGIFGSLPGIAIGAAFQAKTKKKKNRKRQRTAGQ